jgi:hypothetical protein
MLRGRARRFRAPVSSGVCAAWARAPRRGRFTPREPAEVSAAAEPARTRPEDDLEPTRRRHERIRSSRSVADGHQLPWNRSRRRELPRESVIRKPIFLLLAVLIASGASAECREPGIRGRSDLACPQAEPGSPPAQTPPTFGPDPARSGTEILRPDGPGTKAIQCTSEKQPTGEAEREDASRESNNRRAHCSLETPG